jgi:hypothetical protein
MVESTQQKAKKKSKKDIEKLEKYLDRMEVKEE